MRHETLVDQEIAELYKIMVRKQHAAASSERSIARHPTEWNIAKAEKKKDEAIKAKKNYTAAEDQYEGWSRFYLVSSTNGHIHSAMSCSTCYPSTQFGWLPELSGSTEEEAVNNHGNILCTICYPTAPTEWTRGKPSKDEKKAAERKAKGEERKRKQLENALIAGDVEACVIAGTDWLKTLRSASMWLTDAAEWEEAHPSFPPEDVTKVAEALAERKGTTVQEELSEAAKRGSTPLLMDTLRK